MLKLATSMEIGNYLKKIIIDKYPNTRKFCNDYLMKKNDNRPTNEDIAEISKHFSNVLKGNETLSIDDLPVLSELLDLSYNEILSAGKESSFNDQRMNNYKFVFSNDPNVWEEYINREDKAYSNPDEYGKTIIDYALEYNRYELLKFLMKKNFIWFTDDDPTTYYMSFKADTCINHGFSDNIDGIDGRLSKADLLRDKLIDMALDHSDVEVLDALRAREIPTLYDAANYLSTHPSIDDYRDLQTIAKIANTSNEVLDYYSSEFSITADHNFHAFFIYPYIADLIKIMIKEKHPYTSVIIKRATAHNEKVYKRLVKLVNDAVEDMCSEEWQKDMRSLNEKLVKRHIYFKQDKRIINFTYQTNESRIVSDIINLDLRSNDENINQLINELKESYRKIIDFKN